MAPPIDLSAHSSMWHRVYSRAGLGSPSINRRVLPEAGADLVPTSVPLEAKMLFRVSGGGVREIGTGRQLPAGPGSALPIGVHLPDVSTP
jgi:hypothetical protein